MILRDIPIGAPVLMTWPDYPIAVGIVTDRVASTTGKFVYLVKFGAGDPMAVYPPALFNIAEHDRTASAFVREIGHA